MPSTSGKTFKDLIVFLVIFGVRVARESIAFLLVLFPSVFYLAVCLSLCLSPRIATFFWDCLLFSAKLSVSFTRAGSRREIAFTARFFFGGVSIDEIARDRRSESNGRVVCLEDEELGCGRSAVDRHGCS